MYTDATTTPKLIGRYMIGITHIQDKQLLSDSTSIVSSRPVFLDYCTTSTTEMIIPSFLKPVKDPRFRPSKFRVVRAFRLGENFVIQIA